MKIRHGLVLTLATSFGLVACSGGPAPVAISPVPAAQPVGETLAQGQSPRETDDTRAAAEALANAAQAADEEAAQMAFTAALQAAQAGIAADGTNPLPHLQAGRALIGLDRLSEAAEHLGHAEELRPVYILQTEGLRESVWLARYRAAAPLVNEGNYEEAIELFEGANAIYDQRPEIRVTLGQLYAALGQPDKALENFDRALAIVDEFGEDVAPETLMRWHEQVEEIPRLRASVLAEAGRLEEATMAFQALAAENPDDIGIKRNLAAALMQTGREEEAQQIYDELMSGPSLTAFDLYQIGVGFYQGDDYEGAVRAFSAAAGKSPNDRDALEMWARSLQIDSAWADVPPVAERWIELDPNSRNARLILAQAVNEMGDGGRASELIAEIGELAVIVNDLELTHVEGGARVSGRMINQAAAPDAQVEISFTFYDTEGTEIGTAARTMTAGEAETATAFQVEIASDRWVAGYGYTINVM